MPAKKGVKLYNYSVYCGDKFLFAYRSNEDNFLDNLRKKVILYKSFGYDLFSGSWTVSVSFGLDYKFSNGILCPDGRLACYSRHI